MPIPAELDLILVQGKAFRFNFQLTDSAGTPIDCTGYDANMQIGTQSAELGGTVFATARYLNADGNIAVGTIAPVNIVQGEWSVFIPAHLLETAPIGDQRYDIDLIPPAGSDYKEQYIRGAMTVLDRITVL